MTRILVTGARGFIGRHCLHALLSKNFEVHAVTSQKVAPSSSAIWHTVNLLEANEIKHLVERVAPTHLLHLAWVTEPGKYWTASENFEWVQASLTLIRKFSECGGQRVVVAGSCAEYDWGNELCCEENTPLKPITVYGTCKHAGHLLMRSFADQAGLSFAWGRIFHLYGPEEAPVRLVAATIRALLNNQPARCTHGRQVRDFLHVEDVASAFSNILESSVTGPINIGSGQSTTIKDLVNMIGEKLHKKELLTLGALQASTSDPPILLPQTTRLYEEVGWKPQYDLESGLTHTINWWRKNLEKVESNATDN
jgi:nucleoside-diphosphate-sugar epimerase